MATILKEANPNPPPASPFKPGQFAPTLETICTATVLGKEDLRKLELACNRFNASRSSILFAAKGEIDAAKGKIKNDLLEIATALAGIENRNFKPFSYELAGNSMRFNAGRNGNRASLEFLLDELSISHSNGKRPIPADITSTVLDFARLLISKPATREMSESQAASLSEACARIIEAISSGEPLSTGIFVELSSAINNAASHLPEGEPPASCFYARSPANGKPEGQKITVAIRFKTGNSHIEHVIGSRSLLLRNGGREREIPPPQFFKEVLGLIGKAAKREMPPAIARKITTSSVVGMAELGELVNSILAQEHMQNFAAETNGGKITVVRVDGVPYLYEIECTRSGTFFSYKDAHISLPRIRATQPYVLSNISENLLNWDTHYLFSANPG